MLSQDEPDNTNTNQIISPNIHQNLINHSQNRDINSSQNTSLQYGNHPNYSEQNFRSFQKPQNQFQTMPHEFSDSKQSKRKKSSSKSKKRQRSENSYYSGKRSRSAMSRKDNISSAAPGMQGQVYSTAYQIDRSAN